MQDPVVETIRDRVPPFMCPCTRNRCIEGVPGHQLFERSSALPHVVRRQGVRPIDIRIAAGILVQAGLGRRGEVAGQVVKVVVPQHIRCPRRRQVKGCHRPSAGRVGLITTQAEPYAPWRRTLPPDLVCPASVQQDHRIADLVGVDHVRRQGLPQACLPSANLRRRQRGRGCFLEAHDVPVIGGGELRDHQDEALEARAA